MLKITIAHNRYQQAGGEDSVVRHETAMLVRHGHTVESILVDNDHIHGAGSQIVSAIRSFYSRPSYKMVAEAVAAFQPDVLHVHNFVPTLSPSIFFAAHDANVPVVQTLHNYRLLCANAQFFRAGAPCEKCLESRSFLPGVRYACYRGSRVGSAVMGGGMCLHDTLGTWSHRVDRYIALTQFAADKLGKFRVPRSKISIKPNFVEDRGIGQHQGGFALFVGRLSEEKGIHTLLRADATGQLSIPLKLVGDGPLSEEVRRASERKESQITWLGRKSTAETIELMKDATVLLVPSIWYEGFPMVIAEALSVGLPIIASRIGGLPEVVQEGFNGLTFEAGEEVSLGKALDTFVNLQSNARMSANARQSYLDKYGEEQNYNQLITIYEDILTARSATKT
jgi:glycosyltransferase involved in cell wall biosynthesis